MSLLGVPLTIFLLLVAISAAVGLFFFFIMDRGGARAAERLDVLVGKRKKESAADLLLKKSIEEGDKNTLLDALTPKMMSLDKLFEQAECNIKPSTLVGVSLAMGAICASFSFVLIRNFWIAPIVGLVGFSLPWFWLMNKRRARLKAFAAQLPDALELVARALRAGHALGAGMHVVAEEMPDPIASEFGRVYEEQNLGIALEDAMRSMSDRVPNMDLRFFVTAVAIQRQTGGDLAEILDKIGYVIRERYKILGQVKALTAEGRLSGVVLLILPWFLLLTMMHINYSYVQLLWTHPTLFRASIAMLIWMFLGALIIRKIVDIKV